MGHNVAEFVRLMLVTDDALVAGRDLVALALSAEQGGITSIQLRLKRASARELAEAVRSFLRVLEIPVLVNDRLDVALGCGAAGVHLGPDDLPVALARRIAPLEFVIGASVGTVSEAASAGAADYWGIGPWRETRTKNDAGAGLGVEGFRAIVRLAEGKPSIAIGGIIPEDVPVVVGSGGSGVAVVSGILGAENIKDAARRYAKAGNGAAGSRRIAQ